MFIKSLSNDFTGLVDVGRNVLFIEISQNGTYIDNDKILDKCLMENYIVFVDNENFYQKEDLTKIIKTINKRNNHIKIWIYCTPFAKLSSKVDNTQYNILFDMSLEYDKVKDVIIEHYVTYNSNFIFYVNSQEDINKVNNLVIKFLIPKKLVYLSTMEDNIKRLKENAILNKYNFCPDFKQMLWDEV